MNGSTNASFDYNISHTNKNKSISGCSSLKAKSSGKDNDWGLRIRRQSESKKTIDKNR